MFLVVSTKITDISGESSRRTMRDDFLHIITPISCGVYQCWGLHLFFVARLSLLSTKKHYLCTRFSKRPVVARAQGVPTDSLAQLVEHNTFNVGVLGSSPKRITLRVVWMPPLICISRTVLFPSAHSPSVRISHVPLPLNYWTSRSMLHQNFALTQEVATGLRHRRATFAGRKDWTRQERTEGERRPCARTSITTTAA